MKRMKWMYMLLTACLLMSCAAYKTESRMQDIQLGMSKKKVVSILGRNYEPMGARVTPDGTIETIRYFSTSVLGDNADYFPFKIQTELDNSLIINFCILSLYQDVKRK